MLILFLVIFLPGRLILNIQGIHCRKTDLTWIMIDRFSFPKGLNWLKKNILAFASSYAHRFSARMSLFGRVSTSDGQCFLHFTHLPTRASWTNSFWMLSHPNMALNVESDITHPHGHHVGLRRPVVIVEHHHRQHHAARHHHHDAVEVGAWEREWQMIKCVRFWSNSVGG